MKEYVRRLAALETRLAATQPTRDLITLEEWLQWNRTGAQPDRWLSSAALQAHVAVMLERQNQAEAMLALLDDCFARAQSSEGDLAT